MHDEVEFLIEQILARKEEADAGGSVRDPSCPDVTLLMAVALDQAPADTQREVEGHCAQCADCRTRLEDYRTYYRDGAVPEPSVEGSLLEIAADRRDFVPKPLRGDDLDGRLDDLRGAVPVGYTGLAQSRESWPALAQELRVWLPYLLGYVGLGPAQTDAMLSYVEQRIPIRQDQRLSLLAGWLVDFARTVQPARTDVSPVAIDRPLVERIALRIVLDPVAEDETDDQRRFREAARAHPFSSVDDLLRFVPEGRELPRDVLEYRSHLYSRGREKTGEGLRLLQVA